MVEHLTVDFDIPRLVLLCRLLLLSVVGHLGPMPRMLLSLLLIRRCLQRLYSCKGALPGGDGTVEGQVD